MKGIYLGVEVTIIEDLGNGWIITEWPDGKQWKQWKDQVRVGWEYSEEKAGAHRGYGG